MDFSLLVAVILVPGIHVIYYPWQITDLWTTWVWSKTILGNTHFLSKNRHKRHFFRLEFKQYLLNFDLLNDLLNH